MFNILDYDCNVETGEIKNNKLKVSYDNLKVSYDNLKDKSDLNFVSQMLLNCQFEILECVLKLKKLEDKENIPIPLKINLGKLEGVYLSSLIVYQYLLDNGRVNRSQLQLQMDFFSTLREEKWLMQIPEFKTWFTKIIAYLKQHFK